MSASDEFEEKHLTPSGWVRGSSHYDFGEPTIVPVPKDAVLTAYRRVRLSSVYSKPDVEQHEKELVQDKALIAELKAKFGKPSFSV